MKLTYVVQPEDAEEFQKIVREAFRQELGCEIEFVKQPDGTLSILPAKKPAPHETETTRSQSAGRHHGPVTSTDALASKFLAVRVFGSRLDVPPRHSGGSEPRYY